MDDLTLRPIAADESLDPLFDLDELTFHDAVAPAHRTLHGATIRREETLCAYDGERLVGSSVVYPLDLSVPGGALRAGAVSWVSVAPTHRRRGVMRGMMEGQLRRMADAGVPVAVLWAAEAPLYGRFGYGAATAVHATKVRLRERDSGLRDGLSPRPVRLVPASDARADAEDVYARLGRERAGVLARDADWWANEVLADPAEGRTGGPLRVVVAGGQGDGVAGERPDGYALYRVRTDRAQPEEAAGVVDVEELVALTPQARCDLWAYLLSIDLAGVLDAPLLAVDDPLLPLLGNPRTAEQTLRDALWVRVLDVPAAVAGRTWSATVRVTVEIQDDVLPRNAGRWRLDLGPDGSRCTRTDDPADLVLPVAELGAAYLGGGSLVRAADAGVVSEPTVGAAEAFDRAARTARPPRNVAVF